MAHCDMGLIKSVYKHSSDTFQRHTFQWHDAQWTFGTASMVGADYYSSTTLTIGPSYEMLPARTPDCQRNKKQQKVCDRTALHNPGWLRQALEQLEKGYRRAVLFRRKPKPSCDSDGKQNIMGPGEIFIKWDTSFDRDVMKRCQKVGLLALWHIQYTLPKKSSLRTRSSGSFPLSTPCQIGTDNATEDASEKASPVSNTTAAWTPLERTVPLCFGLQWRKQWTNKRLSLEQWRLLQWRKRINTYIKKVVTRFWYYNSLPCCTWRFHECFADRVQKWCTNAAYCEV